MQIDWERLAPEETEQDQFTRPKEAQQKDEEAMQNDQETPEALQLAKAPNAEESEGAQLDDESNGKLLLKLLAVAKQEFARVYWWCRNEGEAKT